MRVRWLRTALFNLGEEAAYIAADDPQAAGQVVARALNASPHSPSIRRLAGQAASPEPAN